MKNLLVMAKQPDLAAAISVVLDPERYRVLSRKELAEAEPLLRQGLIDACVLEAELTEIQPIRIVEQLRHLMPHCPILIYSTTIQREWEEEAYLQGATHVLSKPIRGGLLNALLDRLWSPTGPPPNPGAAYVRMPEGSPPEPLQDARPTLAVLRDFSRILGYSLCSGALLKQFLLLLREILGVNRAAIFLRPPPGSWHSAGEAPEDRQMHSACAIGIAPGLLEDFALSLDSGIGAYVYQRGQILKSSCEESHRNREIRKEFELLGAQVAIPILDREFLVGIAVFDGRLTGESLVNEELSLIFHLLEQLGMAIKNSWLHDAVVAGHEMMTDILSQLGSGCVVVGRRLEVLHCNRMAEDLFSRRNEPGTKLAFCDLPQTLGSKVFEVLKTGQGLPPFPYRPPENSGRTYRITISPFFRRSPGAANAVLVLIEDFTQVERSQQLEIESNNLRAIRKIAEKLAHEIGNAVVPLSTYQQLLQLRLQQPAEPEFLEFSRILTVGVERISRLAQQMLFLAQDTLARSDQVSVSTWIKESFAESQAWFPSKTARLKVQNSAESITFRGNRSALKAALSEILLNAFQANPSDPAAEVRVLRERREQGSDVLRLEVHDQGPGFKPETIQQAEDPFFSTRTVGLGLGLSVARKIVQAHQGKLEIGSSNSSHHGQVCLCLPLNDTQTVSQQPDSQSLQTGPFSL